MENQDMSNLQPPLRENPPAETNYKPCKSCGSLIGPTEKVCPQCGAKAKKSPAVKIVVAVLVPVVIVLIAWIVFGVLRFQPQMVHVDPAPDRYEIGETVPLENASFTVNKFTRQSTYNDRTAEDGKEFVLVEIQITNEADEFVPISDYTFKMRNSQNEVIVQDSTDGFGFSLSPGAVVTMTAVFEEPIGDPDLTLVYEGKLLKSGQVGAFVPLQ